MADLPAQIKVDTEKTTEKLEELISELQEMLEFLRSESDRVQCEIVNYAQLQQSVAPAATKIKTPVFEERFPRPIERPRIHIRGHISDSSSASRLTATTQDPPRLIFAEVLCCRARPLGGVASATRFHYCLDFRPFVLLLRATCSNWRMTLAA